MDKAYRINTTCFRYIIPFKFNGPFEHAVECVDSMESWNRVLNSSYTSDSDLYDYVKNEFHFDDAESISDNKSGFAWSNTNTTKELVYYVDENIEVSIQISESGLLLFRNHLGLFWYELTVPENTLDSAQLIKFQNVARALNSTRKAVIWKTLDTKEDYSVEKNTTYVKPFSFGKWIHETINFLDVAYFSERDNFYEKMMQKSFDSFTYQEASIAKKLPNKAILFSYVSLNDKELTTTFDKCSYIYHITNGYTEDYHCSDEVMHTIQQPFKDAYWYATQEGTSYVVWPSEDNKDFWDNYLVNKRIRSDYFTLYLKVLYQSFSLLVYAERIQSEISSISGKYLSENEDKNITKLCAEINLFLAKSMATSVSHIHHQSEFYVYLKKQLRIHDDVKSVTSGLNALDVLHREQDKIEAEKQLREREERDKMSDAKLQHSMEVLSILSVFSALIDCFDIIANFNLSDGEYWSLPVITKIVEAIFLLGIIIIGIHTLIAIIKKDED